MSDGRGFAPLGWLWILKRGMCKEALALCGFCGLFTSHILQAFERSWEENHDYKGRRSIGFIYLT